MTARLERVSFRAVGTECTAAVGAGPGDGRSARRALAAATAEVAACEAALSRFVATSDLARLNAAGGDWTPVDARLLEALELAVRAREATAGRFDPTVLPALVAAGYDRSYEQLAERPPRRLDGWRAGAAVELDPVAGRARLERGCAVDLGGIGKGYAAGRALAAIAEAWPTVPGALVDLGGDLEVGGRPPGPGPWRIALADPHRPGASLGLLLVEAGGVATSGRNVRRFGPERSLHHLIDPATGEPAGPGPLTVTVVGPTAAEAEAHATALAMAGPSEAARYVAGRPHLSAVYVPHDGAPILLGRPPLARTRVLVRAAS